ncbi:DUF4573 domain-containing protein [Terrabacter sp. Soil810]|uniref:DUF4573 domain-containing protein n=1 Tax=Terrabacter sp. Soil810 TaxID=1736418 RepID=UPI003510FB1C
MTARRSSGRPGQHRSAGDLVRRERRARRAGTTPEHPVDDVCDPLVGSDALPAHLAHPFGGHRARRALDDAGQVDLLDDVLGQADEVEPGDDGVEVEPLGDGIHVDPVQYRVDVHAPDDGVDVHTRDGAVEVHPCDDRVDVHTRDRAVEVHPCDDRVDVEPLDDRPDVDPGHRPVEIHPGDDRVDVEPLDDRVDVHALDDRVDVDPVDDRPDVHPGDRAVEVHRMHHGVEVDVVDDDVGEVDEVENGLDHHRSHPLGRHLGGPTELTASRATAPEQLLSPVGAPQPGTQLGQGRRHRRRHDARHDARDQARRPDPLDDPTDGLDPDRGQTEGQLGEVQGGQRLEPRVRRLRRLRHVRPRRLGSRGLVHASSSPPRAPWPTRAAPLTRSSSSMRPNAWACITPDE